MSRLEFRNVTKRYGPVVAVERASFVARKGEFLALLGPSGCGKSSSMRMIAGLEAISEGEILFDERVVNDLKPRERNVALAFESYALYSPLTVYENLALPLQNGRMSKAALDARVRDIARQFELTPLLDRKPANLSGGQSQRVSLARALVRKPDVLLLDEPLSHLDHRLRVLLRARIRHIHDTSGGTTTVYVTHDQEEATALADRIIVMNHARIQQIGTFDELWERPVNLFVAGFVGDPAMNILPGRREGEALRIGQALLPLPQRFRAARWPASGEVAAGVRPDRLTLVPPDSGGALPRGQVLVDEYQGDRSIVTVETETGQLKCVAPEDTNLAPGAAVALRLDLEHLNLFDPETTLALATTAQPAEEGRRAYA